MSLLSAIRKILKKPQDAPFIVLGHDDIYNLILGKGIIKTCTKTNKAYYVRLNDYPLVGTNITDKHLTIERVTQNEEP